MDINIINIWVPIRRGRCGRYVVKWLLRIGIRVLAIHYLHSRALKCITSLSTVQVIVTQSFQHLASGLVGVHATSIHIGTNGKAITALTKFSITCVGDWHTRTGNSWVFRVEHTSIRSPLQCSLLTKFRYLGSLGLWAHHLFNGFIMLARWLESAFGASTIVC